MPVFSKNSKYSFKEKNELTTITKNNFKEKDKLKIITKNKLLMMKNCRLIIIVN